MTRRIVLGIASAIVLGGGACGSPSGAPAPPSPPPSAPAPTRAADPAPAPAPAKPVPIVATLPIGRFTARHTVKVVCDKPDWCEHDVDDTLVIERTGKAPNDPDVKVSIELVQANAHTCTFEGTLRRETRERWRWTAPDGEPPCDLRLVWSESKLAVESDGCRDFCGARAYLEASFDWPQEQVQAPPR